MKKQRKNKVIVIVIVALISSVIVMSIGFAVFSDVLTISSNATVTPNADDFKIVVYGINDYDEFNSIDNGASPDLTKWSKTKSYQLDFTTDIFEDNEYSAIIDNYNLTINNISANFIKPSHEVFYVFLVKNEGEYDTYVSFSESNKASFSSGKFYGTCNSGAETTKSLVEEACKGIIMYPQSIKNDKLEEITEELLTNGYKIDRESYISMTFVVSYIDNAAVADGPFTVEFDPIEFNFSTAPPSSN